MSDFHALLLIPCCKAFRASRPADIHVDETVQATEICEGLDRPDAQCQWVRPLLTENMIKEYSIYALYLSHISPSVPWLNLCISERKT